MNAEDIDVAPTLEIGIRRLNNSACKIDLAILRAYVLYRAKRKLTKYDGKKIQTSG